MIRVVSAVAAVLVAPLMALPSLAVVYDAQAGATAVPCDPGTTPDGAPGCPDLPGPPTRATGLPTGQCVPDPSGTGGCVTTTLANLHHQVEAAFGPQPAACWSPRPGDPYSDHPKGRACDYTIGRIGTYPDPADVARGWRLAHWIQANATTLHVDYVIWQGRIWSPRRNSEGWRHYTGGGHYPTLGPTHGHYDHIHVSTRT